MDEALRELGEYLASALPQEVTATEVAHGELIVGTRAEAIVKVLTFLRDDPNCKFCVLVEICGVDYPDLPQRF